LLTLLNALKMVLTYSVYSSTSIVLSKHQLAKLEIVCPDPS
jgi:hypothetical protein